MSAIDIREDGRRISIPAGYPSPGREHELELVLAGIAAELEAIDRLNGPEHDIALARVEALAAPYALAFIYEIQRLDALRCGCGAPATGDTTTT